MGQTSDGDEVRRPGNKATRPGGVALQILMKAAERLRHSAHVFEPPYDPFRFAHLLNVSVDERPLKGMDGYVRVSGEQCVVVLNECAKPPRKRFTLAHELGHLMLMRHRRQGMPVNLTRYRASWVPPSDERDPLEERLCDAFAAELLMPASDVRSFWQQNIVTPQNVIRFSSLFQVSLQASANATARCGRSRVHISLWNTAPCMIMQWSTGAKLSSDEHDKLADAIESRQLKSDVYVQRLEDQLSVEIMPLRDSALLVGTLRRS
jgi:hypothetical protein